MAVKILLFLKMAGFSKMAGIKEAAHLPLIPLYKGDISFNKKKTNIQLLCNIKLYNLASNVSSTFS